MKEVVSKYGIKAPTLFTGEIIVIYVNGFIRAIELPPEFNPFVHKAALAMMPFEERFIKPGQLVVNLAGDSNRVDIASIKIQVAHQKIVMWCEQYRERYGERYIISQQDPSKTKNVPFSEDLIKAFFDSTEWWSKNKTIGTYGGRINDIKMLVKTRSNNPLAHPMGWNKEHFNKLSSKEQMDYQRHLRENCKLVVKKDRIGNVIDWIPKTIDP